MPFDEVLTYSLVLIYELSYSTVLAELKYLTLLICILLSRQGPSVHVEHGSLSCVCVCVRVCVSGARCIHKFCCQNIKPIKLTLSKQQTTYKSWSVCVGSSHSRCLYHGAGVSRSQSSPQARANFTYQNVANKIKQYATFSKIQAWRQGNCKSFVTNSFAGTAVNEFQSRWTVTLRCK